jgi:hypothetical protein
MGGAGRADARVLPAPRCPLAQRAPRQRARAHGRGRQVHLRPLPDGEGESPSVRVRSRRSRRGRRPLYGPVSAEGAVRLAPPHARQPLGELDSGAGEPRQARRLQEARDGHRHRALRSRSLRAERENGVPAQPGLFPVRSALGGWRGLAGDGGRRGRARRLPHGTTRRRPLALLDGPPDGHGGDQEEPSAARLSGLSVHRDPGHLHAQRQAAVQRRTSAPRHLTRGRSAGDHRFRVPQGRADTGGRARSVRVVAARRSARRWRAVLSTRSQGGPSAPGGGGLPAGREGPADDHQRPRGRPRRRGSTGPAPAQGGRDRHGVEDPGVGRLCIDDAGGKVRGHGHGPAGHRVGSSHHPLRTVHAGTAPE